MVNERLVTRTPPIISIVIPGPMRCTRSQAKDPLHATLQHQLEGGLFPLQPTPKPACNCFERFEEVNPVSENGAWVQRWQAVALATDERNAVLERPCAAVRAEQYARLAPSYWTQLVRQPGRQVRMGSLPWGAPLPAADGLQSV